MKKFLIVSALAILFPYSLNAWTRKDATHVGIGVAAIVFAGGCFYYYKTSYNTPPHNPSLAPKEPQQQEQHNEPDLDKLLHDPQPSDPAPHETENNNSQKEPNLEKPHGSNNTSKPALQAKLAPQHNPTSSDIKPTQHESTIGTAAQKQISFSDELRRRFQESETEHEAERLLTDHAFSN